MLLISDVTKKQLNDMFLHDPKLMMLGMADEDIYTVYSTGEFPMKSHSVYKGFFKKNGELIGVAKWEPFTTHSINLHIYVKSLEHHKGYLGKIHSTLHTWLKENTEYRHVIIMVPSPCAHIHQATERYGFKEEGFIPNCFLWRQELVGLFIYGSDIDRGSE